MVDWYWLIPAFAVGAIAGFFASVYLLGVTMADRHEPVAVVHVDAPVDSYEIPEDET